MSETLKSKKVVAVRDSKTETFISLAVVANFAVATRMFGDLLKDKNFLIGQHPEDFSIWCIGDFDEDTGAVQGNVFEICSGSNMEA